MRVDLARRLHDGLAQELSALGYALDEIIGRDGLDQSVRNSLREIRLEIIEINQGFRDEIYLLRRLTFADLTAELGELFKGSLLELSIPDLLLEPEIEDGLVRALGEIGRNSARHSGCQKFFINHRIGEGKLILEVGDDGAGKISIKERSFGLASINESLAMIGAKVELETDAHGSRYLIELAI